VFFDDSLARRQKWLPKRYLLSTTGAHTMVRITIEKILGEKWERTGQETGKNFHKF
jgi:hypothetical protein